MPNQQTLKSVKSGNNAFVIAIDAGEKARKRLESLGVFPGVEVGVLTNSNGPMLLSIGESRVMIENGIAQKVLVA